MNIVTSIFDVFTEIGDWISTTLPTFMSMFYTAEGGLTFLGAMAVLGVGVSFILLLIGLIQKFLHFAG